MKKIKINYSLLIFITGIFSNAFGSISISIAYSLLNGDDIRKALFARALLIFMTSISGMIIKESFYKDGNINKDSVMVSILLQSIVTMIISVYMREYVINILIIHMVAEPYYVYTDERRLKECKNIFNLPTISKVLKLLTLVLVLNYNSTYIAYILVSDIGFIVYDIILRRVVWGYKISNVYSTMFGILKGIKGTINSIKVDSDELVWKVGALVNNIILLNFVAIEFSAPTLIIIDTYYGTILKGLDNLYNRVRNIYVETGRIIINISDRTLLLISDILVITIILYYSMGVYSGYEIFFLTLEYLFYNHATIGFFTKSNLVMKRNSKGHYCSLNIILQIVVNQLTLVNFNLTVYFIVSFLSELYSRMFDLVYSKIHKLV